jgi:hypothetical protein
VPQKTIEKEEKCSPGAQFAQQKQLQRVIAKYRITMHKEAPEA